MAVLGASGGGVTPYRTFILTTSQTFTVPYTCTASITAIGGGGGGAHAHQTDFDRTARAAGGGAGGFAQSIIAVAAGAQFVCSIGAKGGRGSTNAAGGTGGTTTATGPNIPSTLTATGGVGGAALEAGRGNYTAAGGAGGGGSNGNTFNTTGGAGGGCVGIGSNGATNTSTYAAGGGAVGIFGVTGTQGNGCAGNGNIRVAASGAACGGEYISNQVNVNAGGTSFFQMHGNSQTGYYTNEAGINPSLGSQSIFSLAGTGAAFNIYASTNPTSLSPATAGGGGAGLYNSLQNGNINRNGGMFAGGGGCNYGGVNNLYAEAGNGGPCGGGGGGRARYTDSANAGYGGVGAVIIEIMSPTF